MNVLVVSAHVMCVMTGSFAGEMTPVTGTSRKSPTMDQGVQTSGGLANNMGGGVMPRGQRGGGGGGYMRGGHDGLGYPRGNDMRRYQPQYNSYGRYQQNDMRGGRPPMRGY